jgi:hypothetical protein
MEELFKAKIRWSTVEIGHKIQLEDGRTLRIQSIHRFDWKGDRELYLSGVGIPVIERTGE